MTEREGFIDLESKERLESVRPVVATSVTLGKELHAGHMLLLATADVARKGLGSVDPVVLLNNNTGPRAAGALVSLSQQMQLGFEDTARLLNGGFIMPDRIVDAYRSRSESEDELSQAIKFLDEGGRDVFKIMADFSEQRLNGAGFQVAVVPESGNLLVGQEIVEMVNPLWSGSGFMFSAQRGIRILKKGGQLTASGKCFVSMASLAERVTSFGGTPLVIFVDSAHDTNDAVVSYSSLDGFGQAMQLQGAAIGFGGEVASGTRGEAMTLNEVLYAFDKKCPKGSLISALRHMVLTRPVTVPFASSPDLGESFFDFKNNESFIRDLAACEREARMFKDSMRVMIDGLRDRTGAETTASDPKTLKWLSFLPMRTKSILGTRQDAVIEAMRNAGKVLKDPVDIAKALKRQGYLGQDARTRATDYGEKGLVLRSNHYLGTLRSIVAAEGKILSLTEQDFGMLEATIDFCMRRLGYAE